MDAKNKLMESDTDLSTAEELANQVFGVAITPS